MKPIQSPDHQQLDAKSRIIVALDVDSAEAAREIVRELSNSVGGFKIGLQLFTAEGPSIVREFVEDGSRIFLDLKFHDIPNTAAKASVEAARCGVWMFNLHTAGGSEMMRRSVGEVGDICEREVLVRPLIIGVTVLTSMAPDALVETGIERSMDEQVKRLSVLAAECGLDGVVASALEAQMIRRSVENREFCIVTPGVRPASGTFDDQSRVSTPGAALAAGADFLVIGRPIVRAQNRSTAVANIVSEIELALNEMNFDEISN